MQLEAVGCLTLRYQEKMQMHKQRQRTGEQRSMRMVRRTCLNGKRVIKKQQGGLNIKKQNHLFFLFLHKAVFEHVYISTRCVCVCEIYKVGVNECPKTKWTCKTTVTWYWHLVTPKVNYCLRKLVFVSSYSTVEMPHHATKRSSSNGFSYLE